MVFIAFDELNITVVPLLLTMLESIRRVFFLC